MIVCLLCGTPNDDLAQYCSAWNCGAVLEGRPQGRGVQLSVPDWAPEIVPGEEGALTAQVRNAGAERDTIAVTVEGLPPGYVVVEPSEVTLGAGAHRSVRITISPPNAPGVPAGTQYCQVVAVSLADARAEARARLRPKLLPYVDESAAPQPGSRLARWRRSVVVPLSLANPGTGEDRVELSAVCSAPDAVAVVSPSSVVVLPRTSTTARVRVRLQHRWFAPPEWVECQVVGVRDGAAGDGVPCGASLSIAHWPVLPLPLLWFFSGEVRRWFAEGGLARFAVGAAGTAVAAAVFAEQATVAGPLGAVPSGGGPSGGGAGGREGAVPRRMVAPAHARRALRMPAPVATALGAVVVAGLAFGGLTLASGSTLNKATRQTLTEQGSVSPTGAAPIGAPRSTAASPSAAPSTPGSGGIIPVTGPVTTTPRILPPTHTGCQGATVVPDVQQQTYPTSSKSLLAAGFPGIDIAEHSATVPLDHTISVSPAQGSLQPCGTEVTLVYSAGPAPVVGPGSPAQTPVCTLPTAEGVAKTVVAALHKLVADDGKTACDLLVTQMTGYSATIPAGDVISENPLAGTEVGVRSAVIITVSLGAPTCVLPSVVGDAKATATAQLVAVKAADGSNCRLVVTPVTASSDTVAAGDVISQSPVAATMAAPGSLVTLTVSSGPATGGSSSGSASASGSASTSPSTTGTPSAPGTSSPPSTSPSVPTTTPPASSSSAAAVTCSLPPVAGLTSAAADAAFEAVESSAGTACGLAVEEVDVSSTTVDAGLVVSQVPAADSTVDPGSTVTITVSTGPATTSATDSASTDSAGSSDSASTDSASTDSAGSSGSGTGDTSGSATGSSGSS